jgi:hypothetical protein
VHNVEAVQVLRRLKDGLDELAGILLRVAALGNNAVEELAAVGPDKAEAHKVRHVAPTHTYTHGAGDTHRSMTRYSLSSVSKASIMLMMLGCLTRRRISTSVSIISSFPSTSFLSMILSAYSLDVSRSRHFFTTEKLPLQPPRARNRAPHV